MKVAGSTAILVGATGGIGEVIAWQMVGRGARLFVF